MADDWRLIYEASDPGREGLRETICALGNGLFVTRGAGEESHADGVHYPGTYHAGLYNRLETNIEGKPIVNEDLVNLPNWLPLSFRPADGEWLSLDRQGIVDFRQELDLKNGVLRRGVTVEDARGRLTRVTSNRLVSMANPHVAAIEMKILPLNWGGTVEIRSGIDGGIRNAGVPRYGDLRGDHLVVEGSGESGQNLLWLHVRTEPSRIGVALAARTSIADGETPEQGIEWIDSADGTRIERTARLLAQSGRTIYVEKTVALRTIRDPGLGALVGDTVQEAMDAPCFAALYKAHRRAWQRLWDRFDVQVDVAPENDLEPYSIQLILRLHTFHLLQTASEHSIGVDASIPARGLHGEAYRGHIFWDEMFVQPFYLYRAPEIARAHLFYRVQRLESARRAALREGYAGAMFPWQSGSSGREETQIIHLNPRSGTWDPDRSRLQRHVNAAIAMNTWRYIRQTGDSEFLLLHGAEILAESARFWRSLMVADQETGLFEICGVMGPDEFHESYPGSSRGGIDNNAYTNVMAAWTLLAAHDALGRLDARSRQSLCHRLEIEDAEIDDWQSAARGIVIPVAENCRMEAFSGYDALQEFDWEGYRAQYGGIGRLDRILKAEGDSPDRYKVSKQADVCMLFYLFDQEELGGLLRPLGVLCSEEHTEETIAYYRRRTSHGSTLSHLVFSAILGPSDDGWEHFLTALRSDIEDIQGGTTPEGIHTAVMAGTVLQVIQRYAGLALVEDRLRIRPRLPEPLCGVQCTIVLRGIPVDVHVTRDRVEVVSPEGAADAVSVTIGESNLTVAPGQTAGCQFDSRDGTWRPDDR